jgi:uracil-DNA glycosylase family 4
LDHDQINEHLRFAAELGVTGTSRDAAWRTRADNGPTHRSAPTTEGAAVPANVGADLRARPSDPGDDMPVALFKNPAEALAAIKADIGADCSRCKLHTLGRKQIVFGVGDPNADLMFVGEAPGADEDEQGIPFVGRAGQLLTDIIEKGLQIPRASVYIANIIKCRPPQNRNPEPDEVASCEPFLFRQVDVIKPKVIVALGKYAAQTLLRTDVPISKIRGKQFDYRGATLIPTFHPAYLLRNPSSKREVWEDMKLVRSLLSA